MRGKALRLRLPVLAAFVTAGLVAVAPALATTAPQKVYVSPTATPTGVDNNCARAAYTSIQAAIEDVAVGGTVFVCPGTYPGMVTVDRQVTLQGKQGATIDATGDAYGVGVSADGSTIKSLKVENASPLDPENGQLADGIVTIGFGQSGPVAANNVTVTDNIVTGNLGSGIDLNSTSNSVAIGNVAKSNGVGINVADDLGLPASNNTIQDNTANLNFGGCGIALADHTGAGVTDNLVIQNVANRNGLQTATAPDASAGSGVILASPVQNGIVTGNTIQDNRFAGNGHAGVVVHAHAPGDDFSNNSIVGNVIGTNNVRTDENDLKTTGIYLGSLDPQTFTITNNVIHDDYYGIFTSGPVAITTSGNVFDHVPHQLGSSPNF
jgi:parallel beta-helix repeat protein